MNCPSDTASNPSTEPRAAQTTVRLFEHLRIRATVDVVVADAERRLEPGEPWVSGLQRCENLVVQRYIKRTWSLPRYDGLGRSIPFAAQAVTHQIATSVIHRSYRTMFADPAKPNRIIFDRFPRCDDALARFVMLDLALRRAVLIDDLAMFDGTVEWPLFEAVLARRSYQYR